MKLLRQLASLVLPLTAAVLVPGILVGWRVGRVQPLGIPLLAAGLALVIWTITLFVRIGRGTLAPWDPTRKLVIAGPYARMRNPMITGVFFILVGEAVTLWSSAIGAWTAAFFVINHAYFLLSEEPGLARRFGAEYDEYKQHVPRWLPLLKPFRPSASGSAPPAPSTPPARPRG